MCSIRGQSYTNSTSGSGLSIEIGRVPQLLSKLSSKWFSKTGQKKSPGANIARGLFDYLRLIIAAEGAQQV
jgi:hypothetical protein